MMRQFVGGFSNGELPKYLGAYMASALMYNFHKKLPKERVPFTDPTFRHVTIRSVLIRFRCRALVRMNNIAVAEELLLSHQISFGVNGGVQQVILACTVAM
jgi:hypothetical protein